MDRLAAALDYPITVHVVFVEESLERVRAGPLGLRQRRPAFYKGTEKWLINVLKPFQNLRIVLFQCTTQPIGDPATIVDQAPASPKGAYCWCSTIVARARISVLWGLSTLKCSGWRSSKSTASSASVGSSLALLG